jgi:TonB family protein
MSKYAERETITPASGERPCTWLDRTAQQLIRHAARHAPQALSERLEEEWLADLAARAGALARLRLAIGCRWAAQVIAHEQGASALAGAAAGGHKVMSTYLQFGSTPGPRRGVVFILIAGLHVVLICGFAAGLSHSMVTSIPPTIIGRFLPEAPPPPLPPPLPRVTLVTPRPIDFVPPEVLLPPTGENTITLPSHAPPAATPPAVPTPVTRVPGGPGKGFPNTDDFYPPSAIRLGESGIAAVNVCVADNGALSADPTIAQSSGSARLDAGALKLARAGSGHYRATTENGRPVRSCYTFRVNFRLRD